MPRPPQPEPTTDGGRPVSIRQLDALPDELPDWATPRQAEIYALRAAGYRQTAIAQLTGWSQSLVSMELATLLVVRPVTRDIDTERIVALKARGVLQSDIARRMGIGKATVSRHLASARAALSTP